MEQGALQHAAFFYADLDEFLAAVVPPITHALDEARPVRVSLPEPRLSAVRAQFRDDNSRGTIKFVDAAVCGHNPARTMPWSLEFARQHQPRRVHMIGESAYPGRSPEEVDLVLQQEALINVAFADLNVTILCPYDRHSPTHLLRSAERVHPCLADEHGLRESEHYTDPHLAISALNRPLPERLIVDDVMVFEASQLGACRARVARHALGAGLEPERIEDLKLAVSEVCANAVTHGGVRLATMRMWADEDRVVYEVRGAGHIADAMAGATLPPLLADGGRGLVVANALCDLVQTHTWPGGTVTRLHMELPAHLR